MHIGFLAAIGIIICLDIGAWVGKKLEKLPLWLSVILSLVLLIALLLCSGH
jgi:hypothetical protein